MRASYGLPVTNRPESEWITNARLCHLLGISRMTLHRWLADPAVGFPSPRRISNRLYHHRTTVWEWMADRT